MRARLLAGLFWALAAPLFPLLAYQGRKAREKTPRFAPPEGEPQGLEGAEGREDVAPLRLLLTGESTAAGVGALKQADSLGAQTARGLAGALDRPVHWRALGHPGQVAAEVRSWAETNLPREPEDVALVVLGVNDSTRLTPLDAWVRELVALAGVIRERTGAPLVVFSGAPPMERFPGLPAPLSWLLGLRARALGAALRDVAARETGLGVAPVLQPMPYDFCEDLYHPGGAGYAAWGAITAGSLAELIRAGEESGAQPSRPSTSAT